MSNIIHSEDVVMLRFVVKNVSHGNSGDIQCVSYHVIDGDVPALEPFISGGVGPSGSTYGELVGAEIVPDFDTDSHDKKVSLDTEQRLAKAEQTLLEILGVIKYDGFYSDRDFIRETLFSLGVDESEIHHAENTVYGK